jgi:hypothetical protein
MYNTMEQTYVFRNRELYCAQHRSRAFPRA